MEHLPLLLRTFTVRSTAGLYVTSAIDIISYQDQKDDIKSSKFTAVLFNARVTPAPMALTAMLILS